MLRFVPRNLAQISVGTLMALKPHGGVMARLLAARGIDTAQEAEAFLCPTMEQFSDPLLMHDMAKAMEILQNAKKNCISTVVYGDYDVDGICANALLCDALNRFGLTATPHVPLREEGYGLNAQAIHKLAARYRLLITVDLGITNCEEVALAKELGMQVIVTDHHQLGLADCPADAVLSPLLGGYPCPKLCGTGVALKLAQALLGMEKAEEYLDLAALATVADIVPLLGENRAIVALGLPLISARSRAGLRALLEVSGSSEKVDSDTLGFQLGPRLNAAGRLGDAMQGIRLMSTRDENEARKIAGELDKLNTQRRKMESDVLAEALQAAAAHDFVKDPALFVQGEGWHVGVVGLAAGRLCSRYGCPTGVFSREGGLLHGSLRSIPGVNIHKFLQSCDDLLSRYGGHEQAAGCTMEASHYDEFCGRMQRAIREAAPQEAFIPYQEYDELLPLTQATMALADEIDQLSPFGLGNPAPLFWGENLALERRRACGAAGAHLQVTLRDGQAVMDGIAFGMGSEAAALPSQVDIVYQITRNTFRDKTTLQCQVKAFRPAAGAQEQAIAAAPEQGFAMALVDALLEAGAAPTRPQLAGTSAVHLEDNKVMAADFGLPSPQRGTLYVARTRESAKWAWDALQEGPGSALDMAWRLPGDPLCFPTLLLMPVLEHVGTCWRRVILLDGEILPGEAALWQERLPHAQVQALAHMDALRALAASLDAGDEAYRRLYRKLRASALATLNQAAAAAHLPLPQARTGLLAFKQLGLMRYTESPFAYTLCPPVACNLGDAPILHALRALSA